MNVAESTQESAGGQADGGELRSKVRTASAFLLGGTIASNVIRLASNIALTRVLPAETFGIMALVQVFLQGLQLFSDIGIGPAIIQSKQGNDPAFLNTAFTMQVLRGLILFGVSCLAAAPFAAFYEQPDLLYLLPVAGINAALLGFRSSKTFIQNRDLALGRMTFIELFSQIVSTVVMVAWAWWTHSIWALVGAGIIRNVIYIPLGHYLLPGVPNRLHWDTKIAKGLLVFGQWVFVSTAMTFIAAQADRLIFGRLLTMSDLGVYSIASVLALTPMTLLVSVARTVVFPIYSRANQADELGKVFPSARWPLLVLGGWGLSALITCAPSIVHVLYDSRYWEASWIIQVLAVGIWFGAVLCGTNTEALLAQGLPRWSAICSLVKTLALVSLLPLGFHLAGFAGAVIGLAFSDVCRYACSVYGARTRGLRATRQDFGVTVLMALSVAAGALAIWMMAAQELPALVQGALGFAVVTAVWSPWLLPFVRPAVADSAPVTTA